MPLAAMSVATKTCNFSALNSPKAFVLAPWLLFPCIARALMPFALSCLAMRFAPCLVREKTNTCCQLFSSINFTNSLLLFDLSTCTMDCFTVVAAAFFGVTDISIGSRTKLFAKARISSEKVAENNKLCRFVGNSFMIRLRS